MKKIVWLIDSAGTKCDVDSYQDLNKKNKGKIRFVVTDASSQVV